jgi:hypothetical protein
MLIRSGCEYRCEETDYDRCVGRIDIVVAGVGADGVLRVW